jgi:hypothetical protein
VAKKRNEVKKQTNNEQTFQHQQPLTASRNVPDNWPSSPVQQPHPLPVQSSQQPSSPLNSLSRERQTANIDNQGTLVKLQKQKEEMELMNYSKAVLRATKVSQNLVFMLFVQT